MDLLLSPFVNDRLAYAIGKSISPCFCDNTAPHAIFDASVLSMNVLLKSGNFSICGDKSLFLSVLKARSQSSLQMNLTFFAVVRLVELQYQQNKG